MRAEEGMSMAKVAISVMLLCLVIGALVTIWYISNDQLNGYKHSMNDAATSAAYDRLEQLERQSSDADANTQYLVNDVRVQVSSPYGHTLGKERDENHPLCTTVANAIREFNEDGLLYVLIEEFNSNLANDSARSHDSVTASTIEFYTYKDVDTGGDTVNLKLLQDANGGNTVGGAESFNDKTRVHKLNDPVQQATNKLLSYSDRRCHVRLMHVDYGGSDMIGVIVEVL